MKNLRVQPVTVMANSLFFAAVLLALITIPACVPDGTVRAQSYYTGHLKDHLHQTNNPDMRWQPLAYAPVDHHAATSEETFDTPKPDDDGFFWYKGNMHTHTLWSDGDQFPEVVTKWYLNNGYNFLVMSEHDAIQSGDQWIRPSESRHVERGGGMEVVNIYRERYGDDWVEIRDAEGEMEVRLKTFNEYRSLFENAGQFLMIRSQEITEREHVVHINATNIHDFIEPQTGRTVEETIRLGFEAVLNQSEETGQKMIPHLTHPNFRSSITAEDIAPVEQLRLFEVYNGYRSMLNFGDEDGVKNLDRIWDIILTRRLGELDLDLVYGLAVDDSHNYETSTAETAWPGRGWVMVRSRFLTPEHIMSAVERGDFYSSTGITLASIQTDDNRYRVEIDPEEGVEYTIQFIGTRSGYDASVKPYVDAEGVERNDRTRLYSDDIGRVLKEVRGIEGEYEFTGDELYVRAKVISSKIKENYFAEGEREKAWLQPVRPGRTSQ